MDSGRGRSVARAGAQHRFALGYCNATETFAAFCQGARRSAGHTARLSQANRVPVAGADGNNRVQLRHRALLRRPTPADDGWPNRSNEMAASYSLLMIATAKSSGV
jgi:hypothetical protein